MPAQPQLSSGEIERLAHQRAGAKIGWYLHASVYLLVNGLLFASSYFGFRARPYNVYPGIGWGLAVVLHFLSVFVLGKGSSLRQGMVRRERERLQREQNQL